MRYYTDGNERYQRFESLEDAIQAAIHAPRANGNVYDAISTTGGYSRPMETFPLVFAAERE